jgi:hypothetical protein
MIAQPFLKNERPSAESKIFKIIVLKWLAFIKVSGKEGVLCILNISLHQLLL